MSSCYYIVQRPADWPIRLILILEKPRLLSHHVAFMLRLTNFLLCRRDPSYPQWIRNWERMLASPYPLLRKHWLECWQLHPWSTNYAGLADPCPPPTTTIVILLFSRLMQDGDRRDFSAGVDSPRLKSTPHSSGSSVMQSSVETPL